MNITKDQIIDFYTKEGLIESNHQRFVYSKLTSMTRKLAVEKFLEKYAQPRFLEIGCAEGMYCAYMSDKADVIVGLDISKPKLQRAIKGPNIIYMVGDWDNLPFPDKSFDVVLATECLEHSLNPEIVRDELFRVADIAIITVPIKETKQPDPMHTHTGHIQAFTEQSIKDLFDRHGLIDFYTDNTVGFTCLVVEE